MTFSENALKSIFNFFIILARYLLKRTSKIDNRRLDNFYKKISLIKKSN